MPRMLAQLLGHLARPSIQLLRPVEADDPNPARGLREDLFVAHADLLPAPPALRAWNGVGMGSVPTKQAGSCCATHRSRAVHVSEIGVRHFPEHRRPPRRFTSLVKRAINPPVSRTQAGRRCRSARTRGSRGQSRWRRRGPRRRLKRPRTRGSRGRRPHWPRSRRGAVRC